MVIKIIIDEGKEIDFQNSVFITGFHGLGWTGYIAIRHIVKSVDTERIGYITGDILPDIISIEGNHLVLPFEFHRFNDFIIFQPPLQPLLIEPHKIIKMLAEWIANSNFKEAVLIGGLDARFQQEGQKMRILSTNAFKRAAEYDIPYLERGLPVRGPLALLLAHLEILDFPALVIFPYARPDRPDPAAASVAIDFLNNQYKLGISTSELQNDAQKIETEIAEIIRQEQEQAEREPRDMYI